MTQDLARAGQRHNYNVELVYRRRTGRACSLFQRLALPQRLLLHCCQVGDGHDDTQSSAARTIPFGVLPPDPRVLLNQVHACFPGFKLTTSVRVCPCRRSRKIWLVRFLD